jgi:hypothetical protein
MLSTMVKPQSKEQHMTWSTAMTDTLYRISKGLPTKPSRVRTHLRIGTASGSEESPKITARGRKVFQVASKDKAFSVEHAKGHPTGAQNLQPPSSDTVAAVRKVLAS